MIHFNTLAVSRLKPYMNAILSVLDSDARIAGGYLRDTLLDKPTKDMDIFVSAITEDQLDALETILGVEFVEVERATGIDEYQGGDGRMIGLYKAKPDENDMFGEFDIIIVDGVQDRIERFPDDISGVQYGLKSGLEFEPGFEKAHLNRTINYVQGDTATQAGHDKRIAKLAAKFPDYTLMVHAEEALA